MSYSAGEALILTRLQAISGSTWTSNNSGRGTWYMLNTGKADHYAFIKPGPGAPQSQEELYERIVARMQGAEVVQ